MICKKGKGTVLRRGMAAFLMLLMAVAAGPAFSAGGVSVYAQEVSEEKVQTVDEPSEGLEAEPEAKASESTETNIDITVAGSPEADTGTGSESPVVVAAIPAGNKSVKLSYAGYVLYEKGKTHNFRISCDGKSRVAYCIEPKASAPKNGSYTAKPCNLKLLNKALYYSYGYPGFDMKTAAFLKASNMKGYYATEKGKYAVGHMLLSYVYDNMSSKTDAFKGVSSGTKSTVKKLLSSIQTWPDPEEVSSLSFSPAEVTAVWNDEKEVQETPLISLKGSAANRVTIEVPEGTSIIKNNSEEIKTGAVVMAGGDSFRLTAPEGKEDKYTSPVMQVSEELFVPYMIQSSKKQDIAFATSAKNTLAYSVKWGAYPPEGGTPPEPESPSDTKAESPGLKTEAVEKESGSHEFIQKGKAFIVDTVSCSGLATGEEYRLSGRLMDKASGKELPSICSDKAFKADGENMTIKVEFEIDSEKYAGKSVVAFEKLYYEDKVIAVHEDINDKEQTVTVKEMEKPGEEKPSPVASAGSPPEKQEKSPVKAVSPDKSSGTSPATSDNTKLMTPVCVILLSLLTAAYAFIRKRRRESN